MTELLDRVPLPTARARLLRRAARSAARFGLDSALDWLHDDERATSSGRPARATPCSLPALHASAAPWTRAAVLPGPTDGASVLVVDERPASLLLMSEPAARPLSRETVSNHGEKALCHARAAARPDPARRLVPGLDGHEGLPAPLKADPATPTCR